MKVLFVIGLLLSLVCASPRDVWAQRSNNEPGSNRSANSQSSGQSSNQQQSNQQSADSWREWWSDLWNEDQSGTNVEQRSRGIISQYIDRYDDNGDDLLSKEELPQRLQRSFSELDSNNDNKLSRSELQEHAGRRFRSRTSAPLELTYVWIIDADQGRTRMEELQKAYALLRKIDKNGDGQLSREELRQRREHTVSKWCDECFDRMDENDDGELSKSEAEGSAFADQFTQYDQNGDSQLTKSEIHRYVSKQFDSQSQTTSHGDASSEESSSEQEESARKRSSSQSNTDSQRQTNEQYHADNSEQDKK